MQANELMIGDWVQVPGNDNPMFLKVFGICPFLSGEYYAYTNPIIDRQPLWLKILEPIPLTPEILEKNFGRPYGLGWYDVYELKRIEGEGIYYIRDAYRYPSKERFSIIKADDKEITFCSLKYVHELQHALRLAGIEKEIIL